jgi:HAD superfamily hydrolase (TIGR01484 family)
MKPLAELPAAACRGLRAVLTDIDDTLTVHRRLPAAAYSAMERLAEAGIAVIPVTGRPAGWCDLIARQWPVAGVVGENGALAFRCDDAPRRMTRLYAAPEAEFRTRRARLDALGAEIVSAVPGSAIAADQFGRLADLAIDFAEDVPRLSDAAIAAIVRRAEAAGATAKVSSIHVNVWFGAWDKLTMARRVLAEWLGLGDAAQRATCLFVGDSPNDAPMFGYFPLSVGVANVADFAGRMAALPGFVAAGRGGAGFAELTAAILARR